MQKKIINRPATSRVQGLDTVEFTLMGDSFSKRILTQLLKSYTLSIELYNKRLIAANYKDVKIIGRTESNILLVYDINREEEVEFCVSDIRIVRVCK
ncbi:hypothetical protein IZY60_12695 [Lutibacter sp. B2]|nr:hypothetical protein [Lutibacter sp. B2]